VRAQAGVRVDEIALESAAVIVVLREWAEENVYVGRWKRQGCVGGCALSVSDATTKV